MHRSVRAGVCGPAKGCSAISQPDIVSTLRTAWQRLVAQRSIRDRDLLLGQLVTAAVELVPAARGGGISRTSERAVRTSHATSQAVHELDELQDRLGEGPCISAATEPPADGLLLADDLAGPDAARWPRFAPEAVEAGFRSILSVSVISDGNGHQRSALNLYSDTPHSYDQDAAVTAGAFAGQVGALLYGADTAAHLHAALETRDVIGRAKGVLMERFTVTDAGAFQMLVSSSQDTNLKLVDVATWLVGEVEARAGDA